MTTNSHDDKMIVCPLHWYFCSAHLEEVEAELRGYFDKMTGAFLLGEGTHRIRAAHRLGLVPVLIPISWWRSRRSLVNARVAASTRGLWFEQVSLSEVAKSA